MTSNKQIKFTLMYAKYKKPLYNYLIKMGSTGAQAEDIVHGVYIKYYERMESILEDQKTEYWLFRTARNQMYDIFRRNSVRKHEPIGENILAYENPTILIERKELEEAINEQLQKLPPEQSEPFLLRVISGLSYQEIADMLQLSEKLVKSRIHNTREKLRSLLNEYKELL